MQISLKFKLWWSNLFTRDILCCALQDDIEDPRLVHIECSKLFERRNQFLGQKTVPHRLQKQEATSTPPSSSLVLFHENNHNYDMLSYATEIKFFSFMDKNYEDVIQHLDPRRNKESDMLGQRLFWKQAFIDPNIEISTTDGLEIQGPGATPFQIAEGQRLELLPLGKQ